MKINCWEKMQCGRQPGGEKSGELEVCPVSTETKAHQIHGGINGGRACWAIQRKFQNTNLQCKTDHKLDSCILCDFYSEVRAEEGSSYLPATEILAKLR